jgi:hypothetical protein
VLPLFTARTIANIKLHHVLIDRGASLNIISYAAFKQMQIPESKLDPSHPFSGVGPDPVYPVRTISLPVTFGTEENFCPRPFLHRKEGSGLLGTGFREAYLFSVGPEVM